MATIISNGSHAVDVAQVAAVLKAGTAAFRFYLEVFFVGSGSAPMAFDTEEERDAFFKELVAAMGG